MNGNSPKLSNSPPKSIIMNTELYQNSFESVGTDSVVVQNILML